MTVQERENGSAYRFPHLPDSLRFALVAAPAVFAVSALGIPQAGAIPVDGTQLTAAQHPVKVPSPAPKAPSPAPKAATVDEQLEAYFEAGYDWEDAELIARLWGGPPTTPYDVKLSVGGKLLEGAKVPVLPDETAWDVSEDVALEAYVNNGYDFDDARRLARLWDGDQDIVDVKVTAGRKILAGITLPVRA